MNNKQTRK